MILKRIVAGLILASVTAALAVSSPDAVAAQQDKNEKAKAKFAQGKRAYLKKLLAEKRKAEQARAAEKKPEPKGPAPRAQSRPAPQPDARVSKPASKPTGKPIGYEALAGLIDREVGKQLTAAKVSPSPRSDDAEFIRRVSLDITGVIPSAERVQAFLSDSSPDKRSKLIDELLASPHYGRRLADVWAGLLYPSNDSDNRFVTKQPLVKWLHESFNANKPWDEMAYELLTASGELDDNGAVTYFMANRGVDKITDNVGKAFLGIQLQCAQCHNHPFTDWKQEEYWGMAQFFVKVNATVNRNAKQDLKQGVTESERVNRRLNPLPESARTVPARFLGGEQAKLTKGEPNRPVFAKWATDPANPYFSKAMVNRTWSLYFGRGFVNPVDDMLEENAPSHPELLESLAAEFAKSGFDLKHLVRAICNSEAYQRTSKPLPGNKDDETLYSHQAIKALTPEQLFDSLAEVLGAPAAGPRGRGAGQAGRRGPRTPRDVFAAFFAPGDGAKLTDYDAGIPQALRLMNSPRLSNAPGLVRQLAQKGSTPAAVVEKLYLMTVSRKPTAAETRKLTDYVGRQSDAPAAYGDILWALLNSSEFALNR